MIVSVAPLLKQPIGAQADFRVVESPIDPHGENSGLLEAGAVSIDADIVATHTNPGAYLEGTADANLEAICSRCLVPIEAAVRCRRGRGAGRGANGFQDDRLGLQDRSDATAARGAHPRDAARAPLPTGLQGPLRRMRRGPQSTSASARGGSGRAFGQARAAPRLPPGARLAPSPPVRDEHRDLLGHLGSYNQVRTQTFGAARLCQPAPCPIQRRANHWLVIPRNGSRALRRASAVATWR